MTEPHELITEVPLPSDLPDPLEGSGVCFATESGEFRCDITLEGISGEQDLIDRTGAAMVFPLFRCTHGDPRFALDPLRCVYGCGRAGYAYADESVVQSFERPARAISMRDPAVSFEAALRRAVAGHVSEVIDAYNRWLTGFGFECDGELFLTESAALARAEECLDDEADRQADSDGGGSGRSGEPGAGGQIAA